MTEEEARRFIRESPFAPYVETLMAGGQALHLHTERVSFDNLAPGASRLAGVPDLPPGVAWPADNGRRPGRPLDFLAQIDLAEAAAAMRLSDMPDSGWLAFFHDAQRQPWGLDPKDRGGWHVLFFDGEATLLQRVEPPDPVAPPGLLARLIGRKPPPSLLPHAVRFEPEISLPMGLSCSEIVGDDDVDDELWGEMDELRNKLEPEGPTSHRLGGHPWLIQDDMRLECQLGLHGETRSSERGRALAAGTADWQLLLQIDGDDDIGWNWGDCGLIHFWIRRQDLAAHDFSKVWCVQHFT